MTITKEQVMAALSTVMDPELHKDLVTLNMIKDVTITNSVDLSVTVELTTPACPLSAEIEADVNKALKAIEGVGVVSVKMTAKVVEATKIGGDKDLIPTIKNTILVGSGKGGVGKSTISVNLAISLANSGAKVGLMDADIYGPSLNVMMGMKDTKVMTKDGKTMIPLERYGCKFISIGSLVDEGQALIWRGPILEGVLTQFLKDVDWGELDYLIIDLPPGTGDVQLSLAQKIKATGAVVVSTPQDLALADVKRSKDMFDKVKVPILGVVENMSYFLCPSCGERTEIFSTGGAERIAKTYGLDFLGALPLDVEIREGGDLGVPIATEEGPMTDTFLEISKILAGKISMLNYKQAEQEKKETFSVKL